ncbi:hypothetical protein GCM10009760_17840 [Kitasatospora kazusensis]|uniref:Uncharacterized protein n=1 Tax=Kitasatospora kazusensis TaxID=407974 RepID=A0ABN2Z699_9ACTN
MEPGAHPTRQPGPQLAYHRPDKPKRPAEETDGPSRKIEVSENVNETWHQRQVATWGYGNPCQKYLAPDFDKGWHLTGLSGLLAPF